MWFRMIPIQQRRSLVSGVITRRDDQWNVETPQVKPGCRLMSIDVPLWLTGAFHVGNEEMIQSIRMIVPATPIPSKTILDVVDASETWNCGCSLILKIWGAIGRLGLKESSASLLEVGAEN